MNEDSNEETETILGYKIKNSSGTVIAAFLNEPDRDDVLLFFQDRYHDEAFTIEDPEEEEE